MYFLCLQQDETPQIKKINFLVLRKVTAELPNNRQCATTTDNAQEPVVLRSLNISLDQRWFATTLLRLTCTLLFLLRVGLVVVVARGGSLFKVRCTLFDVKMIPQMSNFHRLIVFLFHSKLKTHHKLHAHFHS